MIIIHHATITFLISSARRRNIEFVIELWCIELIVVGGSPHTEWLYTDRPHTRKCALSLVPPLHALPVRSKKIMINEHQTTHTAPHTARVTCIQAVSLHSKSQANERIHESVTMEIVPPAYWLRIASIHLQLVFGGWSTSALHTTEYHPHVVNRALLVHWTRLTIYYYLFILHNLLSAEAACRYLLVYL